MPTLLHYLRRGLHVPPHVAVRKALNLAARKIRHQSRRARDRRSGSFASNGAPGALHTYFRIPPATLLAPHRECLSVLAPHYLHHRFDLLGSGWGPVYHGMACRGVGGHCYDPVPFDGVDHDGAWLVGRIAPANLPESRRIWRMVDPGYVPIDWHLDFKSGYRWSEQTWYLDIPFGNLPGVDVKVPWELARMQHLPQLAWAYLLAGQGDPDWAEPEAYPREFRNQVLDFISTNPPRFGVNWRCTMDVAIRVSNVLVAYDLFRSAGARFDPDFDAELSRSVYAHGRHIIENLEWYADERGNHYLSDITGLLFVATYLPRTPETDAWLAFAIQELVTEIERQFTPDGANFEASTSYHRLSAELAIYATALVLGLPEERRQALSDYNHTLHRVRPPLRSGPLPWPPFPSGYLERIEKMAAFTLGISRPDGRIPQVGDNDSARFLKLTPSHQPFPHPDGEIAWVEDLLDHRHLVAAANGLIEHPDFRAIAETHALETTLIRDLASTEPRVSVRPSEAEPSGGISLTTFPDFGLYVYRSERLYLAVRCGHVGQEGHGGHAHNDALSFELSLDGIPILIDPGTYLYTPDPASRNRFRSTASHNTLCVEGLEQNMWPDGVPGLFVMPERARATVTVARSDRFEGEHVGFGTAHRRTLVIREDGLQGLDQCDHAGLKHLRFHFAPGLPEPRPLGNSDWELRMSDATFILHGSPGEWTLGASVYSPGYGILNQNQSLSLCTRATRVEWSLRWT